MPIDHIPAIVIEYSFMWCMQTAVTRIQYKVWHKNFFGFNSNEYKEQNSAQIRPTVRKIYIKIKCAVYWTWYSGDDKYLEPTKKKSINQSIFVY